MQELVRYGIPIPSAFAEDFALLREAFTPGSTGHFFMDTEFGVKSEKRSETGETETWPFDVTVESPSGQTIFSGRVDYGMELDELKGRLGARYAKATIQRVYNSETTWGSTPAEIANALEEAGVTDEKSHT